MNVRRQRIGRREQFLSAQTSQRMRLPLCLTLGPSRCGIQEVGPETGLLLLRNKYLSSQTRSGRGGGVQCSLSQANNRPQFHSGPCAFIADPFQHPTFYLVRKHIFLE